MNAWFSLVIQAIYTKLPWRIQQIMKLYLSFLRELPYPHSDFPLTGKKSFFSIRRSLIESPLIFNNESNHYYSRIYSDSRRKDIDIVEENTFRTSVEILPCSFFRSLSLMAKENEAFQISKNSAFDLLSVTVTKKKKEESFDLHDNDRFVSIVARPGASIKIDAKRGFIASKPINFNQKINKKRRLVLFLFVDGLVDRSILGYDHLNEIMPNTASFFNDGFDFRNHYVNSEWTLPSFASIFSGRYSHNHGLYDPHKVVELGGSFLTMSQHFKKSKYITFSSGGNPRISPSHGYVKGFDRTIYRSMPPAQEVISNFFEHNRVFKKRDQFVFLQFNDLHHNLSIVPDFSVMNSMEPHVLASALNPNIKKNTKSVFTEEDNDKKKTYIERVRRVDYYLNNLYQYIEKNYDNDKVSVCMCGDHGQAYLTKDSHPLSDARTKAVWLFKSGGKAGKQVGEYTEGVDIFNTVLHDAGVEFDNSEVDGQLPVALGGSVERSCSFSQSIYPGQTYKAVINRPDGKFLYETEQPVGCDGVINHKNAFVTASTTKVIVDKSTIKGEIMKFIRDKHAAK